MEKKIDAMLHAFRTEVETYEELRTDINFGRCCGMTKLLTSLHDYMSGEQTYTFGKLCDRIHACITF